MPKLQGPGPVIYGDKVYQVGETVPMSEDEAVHNAKFGGVIWVNEAPASEAEQNAAAMQSQGLTPDGDPLPVHPVTGTLAPIESFTEASAPTAAPAQTVVPAAPAKVSPSTSAPAPTTPAAAPVASPAQNT